MENRESFVKAMAYLRHSFLHAGVSPRHAMPRISIEFDDVWAADKFVADIQPSSPRLIGCRELTCFGIPVKITCNEGA